MYIYIRTIRRDDASDGSILSNQCIPQVYRIDIFELRNGARMPGFCKFLRLKMFLPITSLESKSFLTPPQQTSSSSKPYIQY